MAHWHDSNPWADRVVYVPIEELAEALAVGTVQLGRDGPSVPVTAELNLEHWRSAGDELDAYVLPQPGDRHSVGIRYGADGPDYLSPYNAAPEAVARLADLYAGSAPKP